MEALEEEVRGQPHSRRGRRDAHRATPTRKSFSTRPSSSSPLLSLPSPSSLPLLLLFASFPPGLPRLSLFRSRFLSPLGLFALVRPRNPPTSSRADFIFEPDCTVTRQILGMSTGIYFDISRLRQVSTRPLVKATRALLAFNAEQDCWCQIIAFIMSTSLIIYMYIFF